MDFLDQPTIREIQPAEIPFLDEMLYQAIFNRHKGIGNLLLKEMIGELTGQNYTQVSLSVDKRNDAFGFYQRNGSGKSLLRISILNSRFRRMDSA
jgi:hypothetical protein